MRFSGRLRLATAAIAYGCITGLGAAANASSIVELIGADPFFFPSAPSPSVYFSPDPAHQLTVRTVSGQVTNLAAPASPSGTASVSAGGPDMISYVLSIAGDPSDPAKSTIAMSGECSDPADPTAPPATIAATGVVVTDPTQDPIFLQPAAGHLSWTMAGNFCGGLLKSGEQDAFARTIQSKGSSGLLVDAHSVVVDELTQLLFKLRSQMEVFVKGSDGTYQSVTRLCIPGTGGSPDICIRESVCEGTLIADGKLSVDGANITIAEGGSIQFDGICVDEFIATTSP